MRSVEGKMQRDTMTLLPQSVFQTHHQNCSIWDTQLMTFLEEESVAASLTHTRKLWGIFFIIEILIVKLPFAPAETCCLCV